jgi:hypothetical protein
MARSRSGRRKSRSRSRSRRSPSVRSGHRSASHRSSASLRSHRSPSVRSCPYGQIRRRGYSFKRNGKTVRVKSSCIKDRGARGKGPKLWSVEPGLLTQFGYHLNKTAADRHRALTRAVKEDTYNTIIRRLVAVSNFVHRTQPKNYQKYRADINWLQDMFNP